VNASSNLSQSGVCRFVLQRDDFDTLDQYNDYLEFAEDMGTRVLPQLSASNLGRSDLWYLLLVEILTYGSEQEKTASRLKLAEYEKTYHDRITRRTLAKDVSLLCFLRLRSIAADPLCVGACTIRFSEGETKKV